MRKFTEEEHKIEKRFYGFCAAMCRIACDERCPFFERGLCDKPFAKYTDDDFKLVEHIIDKYETENKVDELILEYLNNME